MDTNEPVILQAIMLSDNAIREAGTGKLTLVGLFAIWNATSFPFTAPPFFITPFIVNFKKGGMTVPIAARIEQPNKHVLWSMGGNIGFAPGDIPLHAIMDAPIPVMGLTFTEPGRYTVKISVDGDDIGQRDFFVLPVTSSSTSIH